MWPLTRLPCLGKEVEGLYRLGTAAGSFVLTRSRFGGEWLPGRWSVGRSVGRLPRDTIYDRIVCVCAGIACRRLLPHGRTPPKLEGGRKEPIKRRRRRRRRQLFNIPLLPPSVRLSVPIAGQQK